MNQNQIQQLTSHLSQALDQNYDVVNLEAVLSVICELEGTPITKEQLEATRLAKYINHLRRRTSNEQLARRAKSLLKKWREMVGIQQTSNEFQQSEVFKLDAESNMADQLLPGTEVNSFHYSQSSNNGKSFIRNDGPSTKTDDNGLNLVNYANLYFQNQKVDCDLHINSFSHESISATVDKRESHTNSSNVFNNIRRKIKNDENYVDKPIKVHVGPYINDYMSCSAPNSVECIDKLNEASVVIDIVSDSDECDVNEEAIKNVSLLTNQKPKKNKRDKKRKEKDTRNKSSFLRTCDFLGQLPNCTIPEITRNILDDEKKNKSYSAASDILSLSNSSMSSMLSGDNGVGNSLMQIRSCAADLSFAGKFKSVDRSGTLNSDIAFLGSSQKAERSINESDNIEQPKDAPYSDSIANEASTSCSYMSPFERNDSKQNRRESKFHDDPSLAFKQQFPINESLVQTANAEYFINVPKKRGRKKGSKGVDSVIAKESSLSQQILLGGGLKKVKTTKELFNEIQNRKFAICSTRTSGNTKGPNITATSSHVHNLLSRPTSSCSEESMPSLNFNTHSAEASLISMTKCSNINRDDGNTDSDSIISDQSDDGLKFQEKRSVISLDSNSNSFPLCGSTGDASNMGSSIGVESQLKDIIFNLKSPQSINEAEALYQTQTVPCTCIVLEESPKLLSGPDTTICNTEMDDLQSIKTCLVNLQTENRGNETVSKIEKPLTQKTSIPQKAVRSIFDLDFDDSDDPLGTLTLDMSQSKSKINHNSDNVSKDTTTKSTCVDDNYSNLNELTEGIHDLEATRIVFKASPIFTIKEDPNCIAKKRFDFQTNQITNFHIDALHNCFIPNINGNWDTVELSHVFKANMSNFFKKNTSYAVTDGSDVVPKYSSLIYERIKKDLSKINLKTKIQKRKFKLKTYIPPFLGVATCLPSCQKVKQLSHLNNWRKSDSVNSTSEEKYTDEHQLIKKKINKINSKINEKPNCNDSLHQSICGNSSTFMLNLNYSYDGKTESCHPFKQVTKRNYEALTEMCNNKLPDANFISKHSTFDANESFEIPNISPNVNEVGNQCDRNAEEYAIVDRRSDTADNHIVLTIKKTHSKLNSTKKNTKEIPRVTHTGFSDPEISENFMMKINTESIPDPDIDILAKSEMNNTNTYNKKNFMSYTCITSCNHHKKIRKRKKRKKKNADMELNNIFENGTVNDKRNQILLNQPKLHQKLFFHDELCRHDANGKTKRILNYSSSSSSSSNNRTFTDSENFSSEEDTQNFLINFQSEKMKSCPNASLEIKEDKQIYLSSSDDTNSNIEYCIPNDNAEENFKLDDKPCIESLDLSPYNNCMLRSFNSIHLTNDSANANLISSLDTHQNRIDENVQNFFNNNNLSITENKLLPNDTFKKINTGFVYAEVLNSKIENFDGNSKALLSSGLEYQTGLRTVCEGAPSEHNSNTCRMQQFKEWHQVLQLKSYKNEPLIVLPYVVLE